MARYSMEVFVAPVTSPSRVRLFPVLRAATTWVSKSSAIASVCGKLSKPDEAIKYPFKPADLDGLSAQTLVWLYGELERLKIAQPLGRFAEFWRTLDDNREKIAFVADARGGKMQRIKKQRRESIVAAGTSNPDAENVLITRTAPMPMHSPWWEPCSIVKNYTETPKTEGGAFGLRLLKDRQRRSRAAWNANGAPDPREALDTAASSRRAPGQKAY
jgi:hypothetical protein